MQKVGERETECKKMKFSRTPKLIKIEAGMGEEKVLYLTKICENVRGGLDSCSM